MLGKCKIDYTPLQNDCYIMFFSFTCYAWWTVEKAYVCIYVFNLKHGQGNGSKAVENMCGAKNKYETMKLFKTFIGGKRFVTLASKQQANL